MNCACVYIFKNEDDRKNIELYQKLAELIARFEGELDPYCLATSKREVKFMRDYDEAMLSKKERRAAFNQDRKVIKSQLKMLKEIYKHAGFDISKYEAVYNSDNSSKELEGLWNELCTWFEKAFFCDYDYDTLCGLSNAFRAYCSTYKECYFKTTKGDIFMWVSGKYHHMNDETLLEMAKTPEEKELVSKVMIGFPARYEDDEWFKDMEEPKLPTWEDIYGTDVAV